MNTLRHVIPGERSFAGMGVSHRIGHSQQSSGLHGLSSRVDGRMHATLGQQFGRSSYNAGPSHNLCGRSRNGILTDLHGHVIPNHSMHRNELKPSFHTAPTLNTHFFNPVIETSSVYLTQVANTQLVNPVNVVHVHTPTTVIIPTPSIVSKRVIVVQPPITSHHVNVVADSGNKGLLIGGIILLIVGLATVIFGLIAFGIEEFALGLTGTSLGGLAIIGGIAMICCHAMQHP